MVTTAFQKFIHGAHDAFMNNDVAFLEANVAEDVRWTTVGEASPIVGKEAFLASIASMGGGPAPESTVSNIITHGRLAAIEGTMTIHESGATKRYGFCDIYRVSGAGSGKIKEITGYLIDLDAGGQT